MFHLSNKTAHAFPASVREPSLHCLQVSREGWQAQSVSEGKCPDYITLALVLSGSVHVAYWQQDCPAGCAMIFPPRAHRRMRAGAEGAQLFITYLAGSRAEAFVAKHGPADSPLQLARPEIAKRQFQALLDDAGFGDTEAQQAALLHVELLLRCFRRYGLNPHNEQGLTRLTEAKTFLDQHWDELADVAALARGIGVSQSYICRLFRHHLGISPQRYLLQLRMQAAASEISESQASLADIAERFGYADQFAFSRAFKRIHGIPPSRLRR